MLQSYATNEFPHDHVPTIFDSFAREVKTASGAQVNLLLWDTAGQEDYDRLRPLCYPETNIFLICFSLIQPSSAENVIAKWGPELMHFTGGDAEIPVMVVGTKMDLRDDEATIRNLAGKNQKPLQYADGLRIAKDLSARVVHQPVQYFECSALTQKGLQSVFDRALELAINPLYGSDKKKRRLRSSKGATKCTLL